MPILGNAAVNTTIFTHIELRFLVPKKLLNDKRPCINRK